MVSAFRGFPPAPSKHACCVAPAEGFRLFSGIRMAPGPMEVWLLFGRLGGFCSLSGMGNHPGPIEDSWSFCTSANEFIFLGAIPRPH